jgi:hypothetical protein
MVVREGHLAPSMRHGVEQVQEEAQRFTAKELAALEPQFDNEGRIVKFKAPAARDFTLLDKIDLPRPSAEIDLQHPAESAIDTDELRAATHLATSSWFGRIGAASLQKSAAAMVEEARESSQRERLATKSRARAVSEESVRTETAAAEVEAVPMDLVDEKR